MWQAHGSEHSAGVTTLSHNFSGSLLLTIRDLSGHFILQVIDIENIIIAIVNIYGYNSHNDNNIMLETLEKHIENASNNFPISGIVLGGDFNMILDHNLDCWSPRNSAAVNKNLKAFMQKFNLIDVWRHQHYNTNAFTWSNRNATRKSRLDFWLVSNNLNIDKILVNIITTPLTDHNAVSIFIPLHSASTKIYRNAYWKLNSSLLKHEAVKLGIKRIIAEYWKKASAEDVYGSNWELGISLSQKNPADMSERERSDFISVQTKLNEIYLQKAKGAFDLVKPL